MSENEWLTQFKTIYPESVLFKRANMTLWIQLIGSKSFFFSCNQERNGGGANYSRVLISPTPSRFALHFEAINNSATGLEKYFNNLPWQDFPVAQLRNLMGFFFQRATDTRLCLARNECDLSSKTKSVNWFWCGVKADLVCTISTFWGIYVEGLCAMT